MDVLARIAERLVDERLVDECFRQAADDVIRRGSGVSVAMPKRRGKCRCCKTKRANRARGLCYTCYYTPGVLAAYPSTSKFAQKGEGLGNQKPLPASERTLELPGSAEKVEVMRLRVERGEAIFHPGDLTLSNAPDSRRGSSIGRADYGNEPDADEE